VRALFHSEALRSSELPSGASKNRSSTIWQLEQTAAFPRHVRLSPNAVGWLEDDGAGWIRQKTGRAPATTSRSCPGARQRQGAALRAAPSGRGLDAGCAPERLAFIVAGEPCAGKRRREPV